MLDRGHLKLLQSKNAKHLGEPKKNGRGFKNKVQVTEFPFLWSPGMTLWLSCCEQTLWSRWINSVYFLYKKGSYVQY